MSKDIHDKLVIRWKPIVFVKPKTESCVLCDQSYDPAKPIVECCVCHQNSHCDCQMTWCVTNILDDLDPTCPYCRSIWENNKFLLYPIKSPQEDLISLDKI